MECGVYGSWLGRRAAQGGQEKEGRSRSHVAAHGSKLGDLTCPSARAFHEKWTELVDQNHGVSLGHERDYPPG